MTLPILLFTDYLWIHRTVFTLDRVVHICTASHVQGPACALLKDFSDDYIWAYSTVHIFA